MFKIIRKQISAICGLLNEYHDWPLILNSRTLIHRSLATKASEPSQNIQSKSNFHLVTAFSGFSKDWFNTTNSVTVNQHKFTIGDDSW